MSRPVFYCENCGKEVPSGVAVCPGCGETFSSVRCPSCGFTGLPELFRKNCPECGYMGNDTVENSLNKKVDKSKKTKNYIPVWVYRVVIGALLILIICLLRVYFLM